MIRMLCRASLVAFLLLSPISHAFAQPALEAEPVLASTQMRTFPQSEGVRSEKTIVVEKAGSQMTVEYSSDAPIDLWISFPIAPQGGTDEDGLTLNPLDTLKVNGLQPLERVKVTIDLTRSPAWSPRRKVFILHVRGEAESTVIVHSIEMKPPTLGDTISGIYRQVSIDEPVLLSSINFLWGYRALGLNVSVLLGILFMISLLIIQARHPSYQLSKINGVVFMALAFMLLYDARFTHDIARTSARDISQWYEDGVYRQLGPIYAISDFLSTERKKLPDMKVAVCFDGTDFVQKQLRYALYPTPVRRASDLWTEATHVVYIDTNRTNYETGIITCGEEFSRKAELLSEFPERSAVFRFTDVES